ncbi:hypothetical protein ACH42_07970 [Endozoicomonas sp. (ex Bugula neritina AB1)]|nr:hypothetical protein ACH42_07970 [Endozoicomonas sp. (ex Bugula neritina AB1)]
MFKGLGFSDRHYLVETTWPSQQSILKEEGTYNSANTLWTRLEIVDTVAGQESDQKGIVEFKAWFTQPPEDKEQMYQERSDFIKEGEHWYFIYPDLSPLNKELGRNELCSCGSGRKYKKCCMK